MSGESVNNASTFIAQPSLIPSPWALGGQKAVIPDGISASAAFGRATWNEGFPSETALPIKSGGVPPHYMDFQGVLNEITNHAFWKQVGGRYAYDSKFDYPAGACVTYGGKVYQCLQNNGPHIGASGENVHAPGAPVASGASPYWGELAPIDGQTIAVDAATKLAKVNPTYVAANIADGATVVYSGSKLHVGSALAGGNLSATGSGSALKLNVNLATLAAAIAGGQANGIVANNGKLSCTVTNGVTAQYVQQQAAASANAAQANAVASAVAYSSSLNAKLGNYLPKAGGAVTGGLTVNGGIAAKSTLTVASGATFNGNLTVKGVFSAINAVGYVAKPAAGAKGTEIANAAWVRDRIGEVNTKISSSGGIYKEAPVTILLGEFQSANFVRSGGSINFKGNIGATTGSATSGGSAMPPVVEGRYIVRNCTPYKPVIVMHEGIRQGDSWNYIRAGYFTNGQGYDVGASTIEGVYCPAISASGSAFAITANHCIGGACRPGQWHRIGCQGADMECFITIPTTSYCVIDIYDEEFKYKVGWYNASDDDKLWFFN